MTDAMLRLARAVYPIYEWEHHKAWNIIRTGVGRNAITFDPVDNGKHLRDTLAWLACQTDVHINGECVATQHGIYNYEAGIGKGLAEAVVEAAIRAVSTDWPRSTPPAS